MEQNKTQEELALFRCIAQGDAVAFTHFYNTHVDKVAAFVYTFCKTDQATEEIVQEVFLKLWTGRDGLAAVQSPQAYLMALARNKTIDFLRSLARQTSLVETLSLRLNERLNDTEEKLDAKRLQQIIETHLQQLSAQKQQVFQMHRQGYSHDEIALRMGISKSTVKNHLSETLKHLRSQVQPHIPLFLIALLALLPAAKK